MNKVILESSIDDRLNSIEYLIEKENDNNNKELKEKRKKLIKRIGVVVGIGVAVIAIANTILKASQLKQNSKFIKTDYDRIEDYAHKTIEKIDDGLDELKGVKYKLENNKEIKGEELEKYKEKINDYEKNFLSYRKSLTEMSSRGDSTNNMSYMGRYLNNMNPITSSKKDIEKRVKDTYKQIDTNKDIIRNYEYNINTIKGLTKNLDKDISKHK